MQVHAGHRASRLSHPEAEPSTSRSDQPDPCEDEISASRNVRAEQALAAEVGRQGDQIEGSTYRERKSLPIFGRE